MGKTATSRCDPQQPGPLDAEEWEFVRGHTLVGSASSVPPSLPMRDSCARATSARRRRLSGRARRRADPLGVDHRGRHAFHAMVSDQPYQEARRSNAALGRATGAPARSRPPGGRDSCARPGGREAALGSGLIGRAIAATSKSGQPAPTRPVTHGTDLQPPQEEASRAPRGEAPSARGAQAPPAPQRGRSLARPAAPAAAPLLRAGAAGARRDRAGPGRGRPAARLHALDRLRGRRGRRGARRRAAVPGRRRSPISRRCS